MVYKTVLVQRGNKFVYLPKTKDFNEKYKRGKRKVKGRTVYIRRKK